MLMYTLHIYLIPFIVSCVGDFVFNFVDFCVGFLNIFSQLLCFEIGCHCNRLST